MYEIGSPTILSRKKEYQFGRVRDRIYGKIFPLEKLKKEFDAVIVAVGCMKPKLIDIDGINSLGIHYGLDFIMSANRDNFNHRIEKFVLL